MRRDLEPVLELKVPVFAKSNRHINDCTSICVVDGDVIRQHRPSEQGDDASNKQHDNDTLAWATGTRVGASDHAIALFCILYGSVLGLLDFKTLIVV